MATASEDEGEYYHDDEVDSYSERSYSAASHEEEIYYDWDIDSSHSDASEQGRIVGAAVNTDDKNEKKGDADDKRTVATSTCMYSARVPARIAQLEGFFELAQQHLEYRCDLVVNGDHGGEEESSEFAATLYNIAEYYDHVGGNWLVFVDKHRVNVLWDAVREANERALLGGYCELRERENASHAVSVHCNDWTDIEDCIATLRAFQEICTRFDIRVATFKPDFMTSLRLYKTRTSYERCHYTFKELAIEKVWLRDEFRFALRDVSRRRRTRRRRRRPLREIQPPLPTTAAQVVTQKIHVNSYFVDEQHVPTRPNGRWSATDEEEGWLYSYSAHAPYAAEKPKKELDQFLQAGATILTAHLDRVQAGDVDRATRRSTMRQLYELAAKHDFLVGKWKVFAPAKIVDALWAAICEANERGVLGGCCKIGQFNQRTGKFLICVYVNNFLNVLECERVLRQLHAICVRFDVPVVANFKCDFLTKLGVYRSRDVYPNVTFALNELKLVRDWPNEHLKQVLDRLKLEQRQIGKAAKRR